VLAERIIERFAPFVSAARTEAERIDQVSNQGERAHARSADLVEVATPVGLPPLLPDLTEARIRSGCDSTPRKFTAGTSSVAIACSFDVDGGHRLAPSWSHLRPAEGPEETVLQVSLATPVDQLSAPGGQVRRPAAELGFHHGRSGETTLRGACLRWLRRQGQTGKVNVFAITAPLGVRLR